MKKRLNELFDTEVETEIDGICTSSKDVKTGDLFFCIKGLNVDRHDYIEDAILHGAVAAVVSRDINVNIPVVKVKNPNEMVVPIAAKFYDYPYEKLKMIGVTGTDGKTSVATITKSLLNNFSKTGYIGTNGVFCDGYKEDANNTTPTQEYTFRYLSNFVENGCENACMEVSSEGLYYNRIEPMKYDISIFTNLSHEHLNTHGTMEAYFSEKAKLFENTKSEGACILNSDDDYFEQFKNHCQGSVITYGENPEADYYFFDVRLEKTMTSFKLKIKNEIYDIESPLLGRFNVYNLVCSIAALEFLGYNVEQILPYLSSIRIDGRMNDIELGQDFKVIVDYAHTPNGLRSLFSFTRELGARRTIVVIGSAGERDRTKRPEMGEIVVANADYTIFTMEDPRSENPLDIINQMTSNLEHLSEKYEKIPDRKQAIKRAVELAEKDDIVFILGKGNETYQKIGKEVVYFNDVEEAIKAIKEKNAN